jgi:hypothetical protein
MSKSNPVAATKTSRSWAPILLLAVLVILFWRSFLPDFVHFSNDGPIGQQNSAWKQLPAAMTGSWYDLNDIGSSVGVLAPTFTSLIFMCLGPLGLAKFFPPLALFILGLGVWSLLRALKLTPLAVTLGTLAAVLNSMFFAGACWGVASAEIAIGMNFFALALITANQATTPWLTRWSRIMLAGFCVGMNVMEGADVGALCSVLVALYAFFQAVIEPAGTLSAKIVRGLSRVTIIAVFAGFIALQTVMSLIGTSIQGVAGTAQDTETKAQHWDWATQWSLPKRETLSLFIPGLGGYKLDTPKDMMPAFKKFYEGGNYWGGIGRDPALDRYFDSGMQGPPPPSNFMRFTGGGNYVGILVCLLAAWAVALAFRKQNSPFTPAQKKIVLFWFVVLILSLVVAWGRFSFFYAILYQLPYFSTIRNPCKFLLFFCWALAILFAYGVHALSLRHLDGTAAKSADLFKQLSNWWPRAGAFDRKWAYASAGLLGASVIGWLIFSSEQKTFLAYLQKVGFGDEGMAQQIAGFALAQVAWFIPLLAVALGLILAAIAGYFSGPRARLGAWLLGGFLVLDLVRADLPYVIHWNYKNKYEVGSLNPIVEKLRDQPYEHRVAALPFEAQQPLQQRFNNYFGGSGIYRIEWMQHHFPYYNIQCLDIIQMPRVPEDLKMYLEALTPRSEETYPLITRRWQLTNTRYLLGAAGFLEVLNQKLDPGQRRFRIADRFTIIPKPEVAELRQLEDLTATLDPNGELALFEFTGALPRVKLYANWLVNTNDQENLKTLADLNFDPAQTVLVSTPKKNLPALSTNTSNPGTVEFKSYSPKKIVLTANAATPAVLLLNDKFDDNWRVTVDGQPADLLRCNFIMRGVPLTPGPHTVEFQFSLPSGPLKVTLTATVLAVLLLGLLVFLSRKPQTAATN